MSQPKVVHLRPAKIGRNQHGTYVSGRDLERREAEMYRAQAEGLAVADIPDDGEDHPTWPRSGRHGSGICPVCTPKGTS